MAYLTASREGKRFLGNRDKKEIHDLKNEDTTKNGCRVSEFIRSDNAVGFIIDTMEQAYKEGYTACTKCIGHPPLRSYGITKVGRTEK
ncbi:MAG: hypothetical protein AB1599_00845 [Planctomycetota bacterium]